MCGIFGYSGFESQDLERAHAALNTLTHRGPDSWGHEAVDGVYIGHRRLSILDLSENGRQPMVSNGNYLTVNGEIYNYQLLRDDLIAAGYTFKSDSDSEVLLHGYDHWGIDKLLDLIDGMFALTIYDSKTQKIYLARDHVGIKPLYYGLIDGQLSWASELKALEQLYKGRLNIDHTAIYDFMTYLYVPCPKSMYQDIQKLEPAHYLCFDLQTKDATKTKYWSLDPYVSNSKKDVQVQNVINTAVKEQLVADVPVGFFLSGGVDSSIVCYEAAQIRNHILTFSIGNKDKADDETPYAKAVSELIKSEHHTKVFDHGIANQNFDMLRRFYDEPFGDVSAFPTYEVCKLAREKVTVVLSGDGGDELYGGYNRHGAAAEIFDTSGNHIKEKIYACLKRIAPHPSLKKKIRRKEIKNMTDPLARWAVRLNSLIKSDAYKRRYAKIHGIPEGYDDYWYFRRFYRADLPAKTRAQYLDFHTYMHDSVLTKVDRTSMAVALEVRVPFLSKASIAAAFSLPEDIHHADGVLKAELKKTYDGKLPDTTLYRKKQGFSVGRSSKGDKLYSRTKNVPKKILEQLFADIVA